MFSIKPATHAQFYLIVLSEVLDCSDITSIVYSGLYTLLATTIFSIEINLLEESVAQNVLSKGIIGIVHIFLRNINYLTFMV